MNKKKWIILATVVVLLGGGGYFGYSYFQSKNAVTEEVPEEKPTFPTAIVEKGEVKKTIFSSGTIEAKAREEVKPELSGKIQRLLVKEGQSIKKGDVLFTIDSTDAQFEVQKQELAIIRAKKELNEIKDKRDKINADKEGKVIEVLAKEGDTVTPETPVVKLANTDYLKITGKFTAFESERFSTGQKVKVFISASMYYVDGIVTNVDRVGKKEQGTGGVHDVEVLVKKPGALYVGDMGEVQFTDEKGVLYASQKATAFELPDDMEILAGTHGKVGRVDVKKDSIIKVGQQLFKMDMTSAGLELQEKELSLKESILTMEQKKREIAKNQVTAPINGVITKVNIKEGETPGSDPAVIIMDTTSVYFIAAVDELDIPAVKLGQSVDVYVSAFGNKPFNGKVIELPKEGKKEEKNVRFAVKIELSDTTDMKHGMTGDCDIYVAQVDNVLRLPINAVEVLEAGQGTVMVKDPSTGDPTPKEVQIGVEGTDFIEIKSGLNEGEEVLLTNEGM
ncbi:HlyD family efflux transporter periplasmic adaptor subunit [Brevibacillus sp. HB1.2]|uniref:efflux RND transporter periplasmic adaptor subunit n=1 Tax=Brevibacillus TaxID=55080 RepID=UPI0015758254|nr:efflux RND transporter periplasmic adaptor subunit [Brevibacillus sp. HB1.2]NTU20100.1 HlyD family efflux transporter periplasmic adaptor subunit [Brevibacillus sp. HB1.2]